MSKVAFRANDGGACVAQHAGGGERPGVLEVICCVFQVLFAQRLLGMSADCLRKRRRRVESQVMPMRGPARIACVTGRQALMRAVRLSAERRNMGQGVAGVRRDSPLTDRAVDLNTAVERAHGSWRWQGRAG